MISRLILIVLLLAFIFDDHTINCFLTNSHIKQHFNANSIQLLQQQQQQSKASRHRTSYFHSDRISSKISKLHSTKAPPVSLEKQPSTRQRLIIPTRVTSTSIITNPTTASVSSSIQTTTTQENDNNNEYRNGLYTICLITVLFASNSPVLHLAFVNVSQPPPVLLLNALTSSIALGGLLLGGRILSKSENDSDDNNNDESVAITAGLELGLWKMLGTTANLFGLSLTTANHGAFLIQLTTLIVPVVQGTMGVPIPKRVWMAVGLALSGVFIFTTLDTTGGGGGEGVIMEQQHLQQLYGDGLCILAALFYATYDLRLFKWGKIVPPLKLIVNKVTVQAGLSVLLLLAVAYDDASSYLQSLTTTISSEEIILIASVALWSGVVINGIVPFLQVGGQQAVGATRAQVVYASQPLWAAVMSLLILEETVGWGGFVGGGLFLMAIFLAATAETPDPDCEQDICEV